MSTKNVLGRGVGALLPEDAAETEEKFFLCDIDKISANPHQPRSYFDEDKLQQLADSIREKGIIQPLLVTRGKGNRYTLVAGERRLRAASLAGLDEVPVVLMEETGANESLELALIENIQRHDLNPIEEAAAYARLMDEFQLTQEEVARKVGRQRSTVTNVLRLLALPSALQEDVARGRLTEGHARVLLRPSRMSPSGCRRCATASSTRSCRCARWNDCAVRNRPDRHRRAAKRHPRPSPRNCRRPTAPPWSTS